MRHAGHGEVDTSKPEDAAMQTLPNFEDKCWWLTGLSGVVQMTHGGGAGRPLASDC